MHETLDFLDPEKEYYKFVGRGIGRGWGERIKDRGGSGERTNTTFGFTCLVFSGPDPLCDLGVLVKPHLLVFFFCTTRQSLKVEHIYLDCAREL